MDHSRFTEAQAAYDAGDFRAAAKTFLSSAGKGAAGNGAAFHMAGNSLMRLRRYHDAVTVYGHALRDDTYDKRGAVQANLGAAFAALGEYAEAAKAYERAIAEPGYATPYKAYQGAASALMERGKVEEAAVAYRKAAIDPDNPDPGKALVNLGLCFMALGRPADATEAYKAALGFDGYQGRGKALGNLGIAYTQMGEYAEAVKAFEKATQMHGHALSPSAQIAFETAKRQTEPSRETVDGWDTGDIAAASAVGNAVASGWDTTELQALSGAAPSAPSAPQSRGADTAEWEALTGPLPVTAPPPYSGPAYGAVTPPVAYAPIPSPDVAPLGVAAEAAASELGFGDERAVNEFFALSEAEMKQRDREVRRAERDVRRSSGSWVRTAIVASVVTLVLAAVLGGLYWMGFGWPTQTNTVERLLEAYRTGQPVEPYWVAVPQKDVAKEMAKIPPVKSYSVAAVERGPNASTVAVTITPKTGAVLKFTITTSREGVGWKVSGVNNQWRSTGG